MLNRLVKYCFVLLLVSTAAMAQEITTTIGAKNVPLRYCGGTISVNNGGNDNQVNLVIRGSGCDRLEWVSRSKVYDLQEQDSGFGGSYTIGFAPNESLGYREAKVVVFSSSRRRYDNVTVRYQVVNRVSPPSDRPTSFPGIGERFSFWALQELARSGRAHHGYRVWAGNSDNRSQLQDIANAFCRSINQSGASNYREEKLVRAQTLVRGNRDGVRVVTALPGQYQFVALDCR